MTIPFSSSFPDPVQKLLGLPGAAGEVKEAILGAGICLLLTWGLVKLVKKLNPGKKT